MSKKHKNTFKDLSNLNLATISKAQEAKNKANPIAAVTEKHVNIDALEEAVPGYLGMILTRSIDGDFCGISQGSKDAMAAWPFLQQWPNMFDAKDDSDNRRIAELMVADYAIYHGVGLMSNVLNDRAFYSDSSTIKLTESSLGSDLSAKLPDVQKKFCAMVRNTMVAGDIEEPAAADTITTPVTPTADSKPSAFNAVVVTPAKAGVCPRCSGAMDSKTERKFIVDTKAVPVEEVAKWAGKMVCQKCLGDLQKTHSATIKAALDEIKEEIESHKTIVANLKAAIAVTPKAEDVAAFEALVVSRERLIAQLESSLAA